MAKKIIGVCWDIDGVLVDTEPLHKDKLFFAAAQNGINLIEDDWNKLQGIGDIRAWQWLCDEKGLKISQEQFLETCEDYFLAHLDTVPPREGAKAAFDHFKTQGIPQGAVSSGIRVQVDKNLAIAGVDREMLFSLSAEDVKITKPHPEPYLKGKAQLCAVMGWDESALPASSFVAIEDSTSGVISAKRAGMTTILWAQTPGKNCPEADYVCYTPQDLMQVVQKLTHNAPQQNTSQKPGPKKSFG